MADRTDISQPPFPPPRPEERTSERLHRLVKSIEAEHVHVGYLVIQMRRRSFGGLFVLLAAVGLLPGISLFAGLVMLLPALQMALGMRAPMLPRFLRRRAVSIVGLRRVVERTLPWMERLERRVRPRWPALSQPPFVNLAGLAVAGLAMLMMLPLPLSNLLPAVAVIVLALGLLERDGLALAFGFILAALALLVGSVLGLAALEATILLIEKHFV